jgi:hypothetical protein
MADINLGVGGANSATGGYDIDNSVKFEADNTEYMKFTSSQSGSDLKRMAFNIWLKRTELGTAQTFMLLGNGGSNSTRLDLGFDSSDRLQIRNVNSNWRLTTQVFRDTSAWYHLFFQFNTLETTADDRIKVWVNGNLIAIGDYTTVNDPGYNATLGFNRNYSNILGGRELEGSNSQMFSGYIAQVYGSGGTPPSVTDFGEFDEDTGIWKPIDISEISPPEPINGFFLDFTDASDLGNDASGNNNNWTLNNITAADQATDTPTNNFCTLNPLWAYAGEATVNNGATTATGVDAAWNGSKATMGVSRGKWYWEVRYSSDAAYTGLQTDGEDNIAASGSLAHVQDTSISFNGNGKYITEINGSTTSVTGQTALEIGSGAVQGFALDLDSGTKTIKVIRADGVTLTVNLTDSLAELEVFPFVAVYQSYVINYNFGGYTTNTISSAASDENGYGTFEYAPPSGYYAICTKNLAEFG